MKRIVLILIGFFPLLSLGYLVRHLLMTVFYSYFPPHLFFVIGVAVLAVWFFVGLFSRKFFNSKIEPVILLNSSAFLILLLNLFQLVILHAHWFNPIGGATQAFYLPLLNFCSSLLFFIRELDMDIVCTFAFLCLFGSSYLGCVVSERLKKQAKHVQED